MSNRVIRPTRLGIGLLAALAALLAAGLITVASANPGNGLRTRENDYGTCTQAELNASAPGRLERFNHRGYVYYGSFCGGASLVYDLDGNPIRSDAPAPGVVPKWVNGTVVYQGVYHGDPRIQLAGDGERAPNGPLTYRETLRPGTVLHQWEAERGYYVLRHREIVGDHGIIYREYDAGNGNWVRYGNSSLLAPEVVWASNDGNHRAIQGQDGSFYREERVDGQWVRSTAYSSPSGNALQNRRSAIWNAYYRCRGEGLQSRNFWINPGQNITGDCK